MIAFFISLYLSGYFANGPLYPDTGLEPVECRTNWWINLLYINNILNVDQMVIKHILLINEIKINILFFKYKCFGVSWYLANDTQFYLIAPLILIPLALK